MRKGSKHTIESREKMSRSWSKLYDNGYINPFKDKPWGNKFHFSGSVKGKRPDVAERNKINNKLRIGEKAYNWKGGITKKRNKEYHSEKYKAWRKAVFERDNYTCQNCGKKGGHKNLQAHHIKEWTNYPELRYDVSNGQTLCKSCHNLTKGLNQWERK